jgi:hypothetical protein
MLHTPSLYTTRHEEFTTDANPDTDWVINGEGTPYPLYDGITVTRHHGDWYSEYIPRNVSHKTPDITGHPVTGHGQWTTLTDTPHQIRRAIDRAIKDHADTDDGDYEAIGPYLARNPHRLKTPRLHPHRTFGSDRERDDFGVTPFPRNAFALRSWLNDHPDYHGIVWHHDDGRTALLRRPTTRRSRA